MTFTATAEVVRYLGADPVFLDVEYGTSLLTPAIVERAIRTHPDVKVLMLVHFGGQSVEMTRSDGNGVLEICRRNGVRVVEDAAHAFPAKWGDRRVGSIGDLTCFSFYANKTITTGEGGMLTTDDEDLYGSAVKVKRLHGIDRVIWNRYTAKTVLGVRRRCLGSSIIYRTWPPRSDWHAVGAGGAVGGFERERCSLVSTCENLRT